MKKTTKNKITGLAALLFGLSMLWYFIPSWVVMNTANLNHTSPDTFPKFASYVLTLLGAALLIQAFYDEYKEKRSGVAQASAAKETREKSPFKERLSQFMSSNAYCVIVTALSVLMFDFLFSRVGYIWTGCACSVFLLAAFRSKKWYHYVIVIAFTFFLYFLFSKVLLVKMP